MLMESALLNQEDFYKGQYDNILNTGLVGLMSNFMHRFIEMGIDRSQSFRTVLEVGAGNGQHSRFVRHGYERYIESDIRFVERYKESKILNPKISSIQLDAQDLSNFEDASVDRLIATCVLVHLPDPESALLEWQRVVKPGGAISIYVPNEPGLLLRLFQKLTTAAKSKKNGFDYKSIHYREHRNMWIFCNLLIREIFSESHIKKRSIPFAWLPWNLRLFDVYQITTTKDSK
jgi:phosphatidylethanolamine/phosphatidyl-N-methylethanolamine N-methyltransferase